MNITASTIIDAALYLGDNETAAFCPTGLSNASEAQVVALVREAREQGMTL